MVNTVVEKTSYAESGKNNNMNEAMPKKTYMWMYMLNNPPKQSLFNHMSSNNIVLELPSHVVVGPNQLLPLELCVLRKQSFNLTKFFTLDIEILAVFGKTIIDKLMTNVAIDFLPVFKGVNLHWAGLSLACCAKCKQFGHISNVCLVGENSGVCGSSFLGAELSSGAMSSSFISAPLGVSGLYNYLTSLKHSLELLADQVSGVLRKLSFVELVSLPLVS
ncbi:hypothetical protein G9A89_007990 [Geosiphon pyriformis]|nr:hypothetical protein G9A89_007990 [Geosiphon pyriformis]